MTMRHYVYAIGAAELSWTKIGYSCDLRNRLRNLQTASPFQLVIAAKMAFDTEEEARDHERKLRGQLASTYDARVRKEWVSVNIEQAASFFVPKQKRAKSPPWWKRQGFASKQHALDASRPVHELIRQMAASNGL